MQWWRKAGAVMLAAWWLLSPAAVCAAPLLADDCCREMQMPAGCEPPTQVLSCCQASSAPPSATPVARADVPGPVVLPPELAPAVSPDGGIVAEAETPPPACPSSIQVLRI